MKNPFLIGAIWFLCFLLEVGLSWGRPTSFLAPWGSFFVLGYAFFRLPALHAFCLASLSFLFQSAFSASPAVLSIGIFFLYGMVWGLRRKTFSDNLLAKASAVFLGTAAFQFLLTLFQSSLKAVFLGNAGLSMFYFVLNFLFAVFLFWVLEEKGEIAEERWLTQRAKRGQLNLFEARELKKTKVRGEFKIQKRVRRRFGLEESW